MYTYTYTERETSGPLFAGSQPAELFEDFVEQKRDEYSAHKRRLTLFVARLEVPEGEPALPSPTRANGAEYASALRAQDTVGALQLGLYTILPLPILDSTYCTIGWWRVNTILCGR